MREKKREDHTKLFYYNRRPQKGLPTIDFYTVNGKGYTKNEHNKETHFYIVVPILTFGTKKTPQPYKNGPNRS
jgi:hypothetical protein